MYINVPFYIQLGSRLGTIMSTSTPEIVIPQDLCIIVTFYILSTVFPILSHLPFWS